MIFSPTAAWYSRSSAITSSASALSVNPDDGGWTVDVGLAVIVDGD
jgi:hypothetical protein